MQRRWERPGKIAPWQEPPKSVAPKGHKRVPKLEPPRKAVAVKEDMQSHAHRAAAALGALPSLAKARLLILRKEGQTVPVLNSGQGAARCTPHRGPDCVQAELL